MLRTRAFAFLFLVPLTVSAGCELIASVDRSKIPAGTGGGGASSGGGPGSGGTPGTGGMGGNGGIAQGGGGAAEGGGGAAQGGGGAAQGGGGAGQGGTTSASSSAASTSASSSAASSSASSTAASTSASSSSASSTAASTSASTGSGMSCTGPGDCPTPPECDTATCVSMMCGTGFVSAGTPTAQQTTGDCHQRQCDGSGNVNNVIDDTDVPVDGNACTQDVCTGGVPSNPPVTQGAAPSGCPSGDNFCDGAGHCVQCNVTADCSAPAECFSNVCAAPVVISEVRSRGPNGDADEFIELYNPTAGNATLGPSWTLTFQDSSCSAATTLYTFTGQVVPPHGHILIVGSGYGDAVPADATYTGLISDAGNVVLRRNGASVDALTYEYNAATLAAELTCTGMTLEGTPATNPHDETSGTNTAMSLDRLPGGASGNGTDTNDNSADFVTAASNPQDLASTPEP